MDSKQQNTPLAAQWENDRALQAEFAGDFELFKAYHTEIPGVQLRSHIGTGGLDRSIENRVKVPVTIATERG